MRTLKDILSQLTYRKACELLGREGEKLLRKGGAFDTIDVENDLVLTDAMLRLNLGQIRVSISLDPAKKDRLKLQCSACSEPCAHMGAALKQYSTRKISCPHKMQLCTSSLSLQIAMLPSDSSCKMQSPYCHLKIKSNYFSWLYRFTIGTGFAL